MAHNFRLTRDRSIANIKYEFDFIGNSRLAVVPVLARINQGYKLLGTASYIIAPNIFITAAHLFEGDDIPEGCSFYILSENSLNYPLKVIEIQKHKSLDLAFFILEKDGEKHFNKVNPLAVMSDHPIKDEIVAIFGYSHSLVNPDEVITDDGESVQPMQIRSKWELGGIVEIHKKGRGFVKGECYETSILAEGRDSGAPMFNSNGFLVGLLSRSFDFDAGLPNSTCVSILNLSEVLINEIPFKNQWSKKNRAAFINSKSNKIN
jgi:hypothetical protein